jgi:hypothetical protein
MTNKSPQEETSSHKAGGTDKAGVTLPGTVEKIIRPANPAEPEKAQINVEGAEDLYREIRIDNVLQNEKGETVRLKQGAEVEVTVEADAAATTKKNGTAPPSASRP